MVHLTQTRAPLALFLAATSGVWLAACASSSAEQRDRSRAQVTSPLSLDDAAYGPFDHHAASAGYHFEGHVSCADLGLGNASATLETGFGPFQTPGICGVDGGGKYNLTFDDGHTASLAFGVCSAFSWTASRPIDAILIRGTDWSAYTDGRAQSDAQASPRTSVYLFEPPTTDPRGGPFAGPPIPHENAPLAEYYQSPSNDYAATVREVEFCFTTTSSGEDAGAPAPDGDTPTEPDGDTTDDGGGGGTSTGGGKAS